MRSRTSCNPWDRQTLTDTGVRLEFGGVAVTAYDLERGLLIGETLEGHLYVFDIETGAVIERREGFGSVDSEAQFNPDKTRLITTDTKGNATLWNTETWEHVTDFREVDDNGVLRARFAPSGELLTLDRDGTILVRDPDTFEPIGSPMIGDPGAAFLGFSGDGTRLLSAGGTNAGFSFRDLGSGTTLWDVETRTRIADGFPFMWGWPGPDSNEREVSTDGENILIWNLNTDEWYDIACRAAGRNMTRAEWGEIGPRDTECQATCPQFPLEPATAS